MDTGDGDQMRGRGGTGKFPLNIHIPSVGDNYIPSWFRPEVGRGRPSTHELEDEDGGAAAAAAATACGGGGAVVANVRNFLSSDYVQFQGRPEDVGAVYDPRVNYWLNPTDVLVQCPYEKSHNILQHRFDGHLVKCRHNYENGLRNGTIKPGPEGPLEFCMFNYKHHLPASLMKEHEKECPENTNSTSFKEKEAMRLKESEEKVRAVVEKFKSVAVDEDDQWGDEPAVPLWEEKKFPLSKEAKKKLEEKNGIEEDWESDPLETQKRSDESWKLNVKLGKITEEDAKSLLAEENGRRREATNTPWTRWTSYNPLHDMRNRRFTMITNPQGLTKSERREYRRTVYETVELKDKVAAEIAAERAKKEAMEKEKNAKTTAATTTEEESDSTVTDSEQAAAKLDEEDKRSVRDEGAVGSSRVHKSKGKKRMDDAQLQKHLAYLYEDSDLDPDYDNREDCPSGHVVPSYHVVKPKRKTESRSGK